MQSSQLLRYPACQLFSRSSKISYTSRCRPFTRAFHTSAPRRDPLLNALLYLPHEMFNLIHSHAPWCAAIPIMAFLTRGLLVTTAGARARSLTARYIGLHPLRQALAMQKRDEVTRRGGFRYPKEAMLQIKKEVNVVTTELDSRWRVSLWSQINWTFAQIPLFFGMAEVIRQKCGTRDGLLGMGFAAFRDDADELVSTTGEIVSTTGEVVGTTGELVSTTSEFVSNTSRYFEPSLAEEGMLWFPDLLHPDPTGVLPFVVSGLMFANIYFTKNTVTSDAKWPKVLRRTLLGIALLIGPMAQHLPAGLLLYWGSSTCSVVLWNVWLDRKYPAPKGYTACKRPLRMPPVSNAFQRRA